MLKKLLEAKLASAIQKQVNANVPTASLDHVNELIVGINKIDATKVRGLVIISAVDMPDGSGVDVKIHATGTSATLDPLLDLACQHIDEQMRESKRQAGGQPCDKCGGVHGDLEAFVDELLGDAKNPTDLALAMMVAGLTPRRH